MSSKSNGNMVKRLEDVLEDDELRSDFKNYLEGIKDAGKQLSIIDIWTKCNEFVIQNYDNKSALDETEDILNKVENIKNEVMEEEILCEKNSKELESAIESKNIDEIKNVIEKLRGTLREELINHFNYYLQYCDRP